MKALCIFFALIFSNGILCQINISHLTSSKVNTFWEKYSLMGSEDVIIAVLGMGVDVTHPAFVGQIFEGWNIYDNNNNLMPFDLLYYNGYHETYVAGIIAAKTFG